MTGTPLTREELCGVLREAARRGWTGATFVADRLESAAKTAEKPDEIHTIMLPQFDPDKEEFVVNIDGVETTYRKVRPQPAPATKRHDWSTTQIVVCEMLGSTGRCIVCDHRGKGETVAMIYADTASEARLRANAAMHAEEIRRVLNEVNAAILGSFPQTQPLVIALLNKLEFGT